jgi:hypothetical protein
VGKNRDRGAASGRKNRIVLACVAVLALTVGVTGGSAAPSKPVDGTLIGTSSWTPTTQYVTGCDAANPLTAVSIEGTYSATTLGSGTYSGTIVPTAPIVCPSIDTPGGPFGPGPPFTVEGTIVFTGPSGSVTAEIAPGSLGSAVVLVHSNSYEYELQLVVVEGTKKFARLSGTFTLTYGTTSNLLAACVCSADGYGLLSGLFVRTPLAG